jgi:hypothetical protein
MKIELQDINIIPELAKINALTENEAKISLYSMTSIAASMAFELYIKEKYYAQPDGLDNRLIEVLLKRFSEAGKVAGNSFIETRGEVK